MYRLFDCEDVTHEAILQSHQQHLLEDAYEVVGWYEKRWVVEEYHKCLKTGMKIESFQFTKVARLQPAIAAITLLTMRDDSRNEETKNLLATEYIDREYVEVLSAWRYGKPNPAWTVSEFTWALPRLSGHQNRKGDHPPGWQKLWKGWHELNAMLIGAKIAKIKKNVGKPKR